MKIVSACLAGVECRYNGLAYPVGEIVDMVTRGEAIPVCPEMLAGLPAPRPPVEQRAGRFVNREGKDQTEMFMAGAASALQIALAIHCRQAILKAKSPTCGCGLIYDGTFSGRLVPGDGIFTKLLKENGIEVYTEENIGREAT